VLVFQLALFCRAALAKVGTEVCLGLIDEIPHPQSLAQNKGVFLLVDLVNELSHPA